MILVLGGARSGKSAYALKLAESRSDKRLYLATAQAIDKEMTERIRKHKKGRGNNWTTIEEPINVIDVIRKGKKNDVLLLDCLTLWISNLMHKKSEVRGLPQNASIVGQKSEVIYKNINQLASACKQSKANIIIVSNEVGMGIVPDNPMARQFRDIAGYANQKIAEAADEVYFVAAGIGIKIKN
ncbi:MAG: bifunctional adenosylcobinamide kinase/adenosylcobinamide-phosphate guanylyltransferase [Deltaproteobacteria bacterium]|nr:bifunctional adenosylcobinamide kinase/adenosylcobinamide-phosphate guanylyltransferase [Deltaproteobacteria bacterium]